MCFVMITKKEKQVKRTPEQKVKAMKAIYKAFSDSKSGKSLNRFFDYAFK